MNATPIGTRPRPGSTTTEEFPAMRTRKHLRHVESGRGGQIRPDVEPLTRRRPPWIGALVPAGTALHEDDGGAVAPARMRNSSTRTSWPASPATVANALGCQGFRLPAGF
jgi:hypothetical protein